MPILGQLLTSLFLGIAEFFAKFIGRRVAAAAAALAVFAGLTTALFVLLGAIVSGLVLALPSGSAFSIGVWLMIPDNAAACVAACISADAAVAIYRVNVLNVKFALGSS